MKELTTALLNAQRAIPTVWKDGASHHGKYSTITGVLNTLMPVLLENDLVIAQPSFDAGTGLAGITTILMHGPTGQSLELGSVTVPVNKKDAQGYGGALTYGRRYGLLCAFCLKTSDDDGAAATKSPPVSVMTLRTKISKHINSLGFSDNEAVGAIGKKAVAHVNSDGSVDGYQDVLDFVKTLTKDNVDAFLNGGA